MKFTVSRKLYLGFAIVLLMLISMILFANFQLVSIDKTYSFLIDDRIKKMMTVQEMENQILQEYKFIRGYLLLGGQENRDGYEKARVQYDDLANEIEPLITLPKGKQLFKEVNDLHIEYHGIATQLIEAKDKGDTEEVNRILKELGVPISGKITLKTNEFLQFQQELINETRKETADQLHSVKNLLLILSIVTLSIGIGCAAMISRIISRPVKQMADAVAQIASGDLSGDVLSVRTQDEIGDLARSFNSMQEQLRSLISEIRESVRLVASSSGELKASAEQTTIATEQIAISIQEIASGSVHQVSGTAEAKQVVQEIYDEMEETNQFIQSIAQATILANERAMAGNSLVQKTMNQMNQVHETVELNAQIVNLLGEKIKQVDQIVTMITVIANQTNLLALNAAIEAARAGEHGRGFAVVADEVRKLADQSGQAADEIRSLLEVIQTEANQAILSMNKGTEVMETGIHMVNETGKTFYDIVQMVKDITDKSQEATAIIAKLNDSSQHMTKTIDAIATISEQASANTQQVAASAEEQNAAMQEVASSSEVLSRLASDLDGLVSHFKISNISKV